MKIVLKLTKGSRLQKVVGGISFSAVLIMALAAPAHALDRRGADRDWRGHETRAHQYWHRPHFQPEPGVVYAPPVVYTPPQYEEPGFNLVVPLNFR